MQKFSRQRFSQKFSRPSFMFALRAFALGLVQALALFGATAALLAVIVKSAPAMMWLMPLLLMVVLMMSGTVLAMRLRPMRLLARQASQRAWHRLDKQARLFGSY